MHFNLHLHLKHLRTTALVRVGTARTCHQLMRAGLRESGHYFIDPDGPGVGAPPVQVLGTPYRSALLLQVYCDLRFHS